MNDCYQYYRENIEAYSRRSNRLQQKIHLLGTIRLLLVAAAVALLYLLRAEGYGVLAAIAVGCIVPFALLMWYHNKLSHQKGYADALVKLNEAELKGLDYDFSSFDGATEKVSAEHDFSLDLDIFGPRSLFQSLNRTVTHAGRERLADWFIRPLTQKEAILSRSEAVKELATLSSLRQHLYVTGHTEGGTPSDLSLLSSLAGGKPLFMSQPVWRALVWIIPILWIGLIAGCLFGGLHSAVLGVFFALCFPIAYLRSYQISALYNKVDKMSKILETYSRLMACVEGTPFQSAELVAVCNDLSAPKGTASAAIRKLAGYIGGLNQRFSTAGVILNVLYLRDTRFAMQMERWNAEHAHCFGRWIEALARFDALCSLGGFAFNHPDYTYPTLTDNYFRMEGQALGHPLLYRDKCVRNDIRVGDNPQFLIVTGANMAGKSTYLRTVGVNFLLACVGAPVCATSLTLYPAAMVTSLRTSDSLVSNESYFFAELKRLKMVIDRLQQGDRLFIILDEILKGTNSADKQKGSLALMKQLVGYGSCGIIATHDLVLGTLEEEFPKRIKNYRFEADMADNTLTFTYLLREGVAQNMNACFLMKRMGITV